MSTVREALESVRPVDDLQPCRCAMRLPGKCNCEAMNPAAEKSVGNDDAEADNEVRPTD